MVLFCAKQAKLGNLVHVFGRQAEKAGNIHTLSKGSYGGLCMTMRSNNFSYHLFCSRHPYVFTSCYDHSKCTHMHICQTRCSAHYGIAPSHPKDVICTLA